MMIECKYLRKGERWYAYTFYLEKHKEQLQVYGANPDEAFNRLKEVLDKELGKETYALDIKMDDSLNGETFSTSACHDTPTR